MPNRQRVRRRTHGLGWVTLPVLRQARTGLLGTPTRRRSPVAGTAWTSSDCRHGRYHQL